MRGRKPAPPEAKIAKGETRPSRVNYFVPDLPPPESVEPPEDLHGAGLEIWKAHAQRLKDAGQLRVSDMPLFTQLCRVASDIGELEKRDVAARPGLFQLRSLFLRMSVEMGMTPVSRSKVKANKSASGEKPKHDRFFGGGIDGLIRGGKTS
jgi:phage terminase small subunit